MVVLGGDAILGIHQSWSIGYEFDMANIAARLAVVASRYAACQLEGDDVETG